MEKKALTYTLQIERHDDGYLAYFPALPGCHTQGKTGEEALANIKEAILACLLTLIDRAQRQTLKKEFTDLL